MQEATTPLSDDCLFRVDLSRKLVSPALKKSLSKIGYCTDANDCFFTKTSICINPHDATMIQPLKRHSNSCNILYLDSHCNIFKGTMIKGQPGNILLEFYIW